MSQSQIGLKALKVLSGKEQLNDTTAQLSEAFLNKLQKINQVADRLESNNGVVKQRKTTPQPAVKQQSKPSKIFEEKERQVPITEILAKTKADKIGINKKQVSPDEIMALLSGNRPQQVPLAENKKIETQYQDFIRETKSYQEKNIIDEESTKNVDIRKMVSEEVNKILFKEIFSKDRLKPLMESVFRDVIKEKAKEILFETLKRRKEQL
jgi:hypothetical protein